MRFKTVKKDAKLLDEALGINSEDLKKLLEISNKYVDKSECAAEILWEIKNSYLNEDEKILVAYLCGVTIGLKAQRLVMMQIFPPRGG